MAELGVGTGTDYPATVDTKQTFTNVPTTEPDGPTRFDAELIEDILFAIVAIETELGTDPAGASATVKARFDALGDLAQQNTINDSDWSGTDLTVPNGGTGTSDGSIAGTGALTFTAGGTNQDITNTPSGAGKHVMNGTAVLAPNIPLFNAGATVQTNVTGDSTIFTAVFGTEITDQGADFDGISTYTASENGTHDLRVQLQIAGIASAHTIGSVTIVTSNQTFEFDQNPWLQSSGSAGWSMFHLAIEAAMDLGDTATVAYQISGGTKVCGNTVGAQKNYFSGHLIA